MNWIVPLLCVAALLDGCVTRSEQRAGWSIYQYLDTNKVEILNISRETLDALPGRMLRLKNDTSGDDLLGMLGMVRLHPHLPFHSTHHWETKPYWATMYVDVPNYHVQVMLHPGATNAVGVRIRRGEDGAWVECVPHAKTADESANNTPEDIRR